MPRQKYHRDRVYQEIGEPGPGAIGVGYVRFSMDLQNESSITTQKRLIKEYFDAKGWKLVGWREEPERSANNYLDDLIEERPVFAQVLTDAEAKRFQVVVCAFSNRWARSMEVGYASLTRLRRAHVWWCTADGLWDIDKVQQDGFNVAFAVDMSMNEAYVRQLSKRTIAGKEDRAREGYHNGNVPFGYLPPEYPKAPDGAPSTWRPPRMPARSDPETFPALVRIGELVAEGWTDRAIANELERGGYLSKTARFGERLLTKDTIAAIRRSWFPRELVAGSGHGTIETPQGELIEGKHQAAWSYELWNRMNEVKRSQYHRPTKEARRRPHEFSRIIVCAACLRQLRVGVGGNSLPYYRDTSFDRKLPCPTTGNLTVRSSLVIMQFGEILRSIELPEAWRETIAERCNAAASEEGGENGRIQKRRVELDAEQKRLINLYRKGYITEQDLDEQMEQIRSEQFNLPVPEVKDAVKMTQEAISAGETLGGMADYWSEALAEERRDMVWSLLYAEGLIYDLERHVIIGLKPRAGVLAVMVLGLSKTGMWELREDTLWLREDYWPPKREKESPGRPPSLTPAEQERAIMLIRQGMPLKRVAELFHSSYEVVRRLAKKQGVELQRSDRKLTPEQLEQAYDLLRSDIPFRQVAGQFGIHPESLRRLAQRDGVTLRTKGEKLTPTQRKLTLEQQQEAHALVQAGISHRQTAKMLGISRCALAGLLKEGELEGE
jgi:DNA invertase Pin-like site-specific DNA recombinase